MVLLDHREALAVLPLPLHVYAWVVRVAPVGEEQVRTSGDRHARGEFGLFHHGPARTSGVQGVSERADVEGRNLFGQLQDLVAEGDHPALAEEADTQSAVELFRDGDALLLGGLDGLERRHRSDRIFALRSLPHLPPGRRVESPRYRDLGVEDLLGRGLLVEQLEREGPDVEDDLAVEPELRSGRMEAVD